MGAHKEPAAFSMWPAWIWRVAKPNFFSVFIQSIFLSSPAPPETLRRGKIDWYSNFRYQRDSDAAAGIERREGENLCIHRKTQVILNRKLLK